MFQIAEKLLNKRILVIGDVMLDEYVVGDKYHISGEAPVPILKADRFEVRLGGAANVANNITQKQVLHECTKLVFYLIKSK